MITVALAQFFFDVSTFFASVVIAMPLVLLALCIWAKKRQYQDLCAILPILHRPILVFWLCGPFACIASFLQVLANLSLVGELGDIPSPLHPAMLPYTVTTALWFAIFPFLCLFHKIVRIYAESKQHHGTAVVVGACFLTACYFATKCTMSWPFAGLPEGLTTRSAMVAIAIQAEHAYFYSFFPCSIYLLFMLARYQSHLKTDLFQRLKKAFCAAGVLGALPITISSLGLLTGYLFRTAPFPSVLQQKGLHSILLFLACSCLVTLFFSEKKQRLLIHATCTLALFDILLTTISILFS